MTVNRTLPFILDLINEWHYCIWHEFNRGLQCPRNPNHAQTQSWSKHASSLSAAMIMGLHYPIIYMFLHIWSGLSLAYLIGWKEKNQCCTKTVQSSPRLTYSFCAFFISSLCLNWKGPCSTLNAWEVIWFDGTGWKVLLCMLTPFNIVKLPQFIEESFLSHLIFNHLCPF